MKPYFFLLLVVFLVGCSTAPQQELCTTTCDNQSQLTQTFSTYLGLSEDDYKITCASCRLGRAASYEATITSQDHIYEVNFTRGWCSSGGTDCGWEVEMTTNDSQAPLYEDVKLFVCEQLTWERRNDTSICTGNAFDNTTQVQMDCLAGEFERTEKTRRTLAIDYQSNRCSSQAIFGLEQ